MKTKEEILKLKARDTINGDTWYMEDDVIAAMQEYGDQRWNEAIEAAAETVDFGSAYGNAKNILKLKLPNV